MKRILSTLLIFSLLLVSVVSLGENTEADQYTTLKVGTTTGFNGNFFTGALNNNLSDMDVRDLIHGYSLVKWDKDAGCYVFDPRTVSGYLVNDNSDGSRTYTLSLAEDLKYSDGSGITAADYAFSILLSISAELKNALGIEETRSTVQTVRLGKSPYQLTVTTRSDFSPYFYELSLLDISPFPIRVIAPECTVIDSEEGAYISGPFTAELLKKTLLGDNGYISHPSIVSGAYTLTSYNGTSVHMQVNPYYKGSNNGIRPDIEQIDYRQVNPDFLLQELANEKLDLVIRCTRSDNISGGMQMIGSGEFSLATYPRVGLAFISFCAEHGPTSDPDVRRAVSLCLDKETLLSEYVGSYGISVDGYYGIGSWVYLAATGIVRPEESEDDWDSLTMDGLTVYPLDVSAANELLTKAGWILNAGGTAYDETAGGLRYKEISGEMIPLRLTIYYPDGNRIGQLLETTFAPNLAEAGAELITASIPMDQLLEYYYMQTDRACDMIFVGSNLGKVFDPSVYFAEDGTDRCSGIQDAELFKKTVALRKTAPGNIFEYVSKWIDFQEYRTSIAADIPLYSNIYFDFFNNVLQNYNPEPYGTWTAAITEAHLSDYIIEEAVINR